MPTTADSSNSESTIYYDRNVTPVTPDNPHGHESDVKKVITHVTHYVDRAGHKLHPDTTQSIVYKRDGELDEDGHFTATSDWKADPSDTFSAVDLPAIADYKVFDDSENKAVVTTVDSTDSESTIVYDKVAEPNPTPKPQPTPAPTPTPTPNSPKNFVLPSTGGNESNDSSEKTDEHSSLPETGKENMSTQLKWGTALTAVLGMNLLFWFKSRNKKN